MTATQKLYGIIDIWGSMKEDIHVYRCVWVEIEVEVEVEWQNWTDFIENVIKMQTVSFKKMILTRSMQTIGHFVQASMC